MIFNELEYAENMLKKGFIQDKYFMELKILAKYYNKQSGLKTNDIKNKLKEFCKKHMPEYNEVIQLEMITKAARYGAQKKNILVVIPPIDIMKSEIEQIQELDDLDLEKLTFVALVLGKISKFLPRKYKKKADDRGYFVNNLRDIFKYANIKCKKEKREYFIEKLYGTGFFGLTIFCSFEVKFVDEDGEIAFTISNFNNFVLEYLKYIGHNIVHCEQCGVPFPPTSNRQKYCRECWKEIRLNQQREWDRTKRIR